MITGSVTVIELLWTVFGVLGFLVCSVNLRQAVCDLRALRRSNRNGALEEVALTSGKGETARLLGHSSVILIGAIAMTYPNPVAWPNTLIGWALTIGLFVAVGVLVYESLLSRWSRQRLDYILGEEGRKQ